MTKARLSLDDRDRAILAILAQDARCPYAEIGQRVGMSAAAVHGRVKRMEERGAIYRYSVVTDPAALSFEMGAFVAVRQTVGEHSEKLERAFHEMPAVEACHGVTGEDGYLLRVRVANPRELDELIQAINRVEGVASTRTAVILSSTFDRQRIE